jgi:hypothetical protein
VAFIRLGRSASDHECKCGQSTQLSLSLSLSISHSIASFVGLYHVQQQQVQLLQHMAIQLELARWPLLFSPGAAALSCLLLLP